MSKLRSWPINEFLHVQRDWNQSADQLDNEVWQSDHAILPLSWAYEPINRQRQLSPKRIFIGGYELGRVARCRVCKRTRSRDRFKQGWGMSFTLGLLRNLG